MNKRGISEVVSYTLLIIIALTMSVIVYSFLKAYVPKDKPECKDGVSLIIENLKCNNEGTYNNLKLTLQNTGRFKIDSAFIRVTKEGRKVAVDVPSASPFPLDLDPQESTPEHTLTLPYDTIGNYVLEVQPAHYTKGTDAESLALCPPITQPVTCT